MSTTSASSTAGLAKRWEPATDVTDLRHVLHDDNIWQETFLTGWFSTVIALRLPQMEYYDYVGSFASDLAEVPKAHKGSKAYRSYLEGLLAYLTSFYSRAQPLGQAHKQLAQVRSTCDLSVAVRRGLMAVSLGVCFRMGLHMHGVDSS